MTSRLCIRLTFLTASLIPAVLAAAVPPAPIELPVDVVENLFFVTPATSAGERLHLYTDSGGGLFLRGTLVHRLGLATETRSVDGETIEIVNPEAKRLLQLDPQYDDAMAYMNLLYRLKAGLVDNPGESAGRVKTIPVS